MISGGSTGGRWYDISGSSMVNGAGDNSSFCLGKFLGAGHSNDWGDLIKYKYKALCPCFKLVCYVLEFSDHTSLNSVPFYMISNIHGLLIDCSLQFWYLLTAGFEFASSGLCDSSICCIRLAASPQSMIRGYIYRRKKKTIWVGLFVPFVLQNKIQ